MQPIGTCSQILVGLLRTHAVAAVYDEEHGIVTLPDHPYRMALNVYKGADNVISLKAICEIGPGKYMKEHLAGWADEQAQAVMDAQRNFVGCVFHVWVAALLGKANNYAHEYIWKINGTERKVFVGDPCGRYQKSGKADSDVTLDTSWQNAWHEAVCKLPLSEDLHWASLCYVQHAGNVIACDALLDSEACEPLKQKLLAFDWPVREGFYSVRQFMIIQRL